MKYQIIQYIQNKVSEKDEGERTGDDYDVFGVIDFGDSHENPYIFDLATTIMYMMTQVRLKVSRKRLIDLLYLYSWLCNKKTSLYFQCEVIDPNLAGGHVLAGYKTVRQVTNHEMNILKVHSKYRS